MYKNILLAIDLNDGISCCKPLPSTIETAQLVIGLVAERRTQRDTIPRGRERACGPRDGSPSGRALPRCRAAPVKDHRDAGLTLPREALEAVARVPYAAGVAPYLPLLPLITDRHVDALTLAGTIEEVADHVVTIAGAGIDGIIVRPFAPEGGTIEDTIVTFGSKVWPRVMNSIG